jgi:hypothetical protein
MAVYDSSGSLAWDLTQTNPLFAKAYVGGAPGTYTIPSLTRPVMVGGHFNNEQFDANQGGNTWWLQKYTGTVIRTSSTSMGTGKRIKQQWQYFNTEAQFGNDGDDYDLSAFIVEGSVLP